MKMRLVFRFTQQDCNIKNANRQQWNSDFDSRIVILFY